ncbi:MAG: AMP phosphorylase [Candidatus Hodarchaeales archaeon]
MRLKIFFTDLDADFLLIHPNDAAKLELLPSSLLRITSLIDNSFITGRILVTANFVPSGGLIGVPQIFKRVFKENESVEALPLQFEEGKGIIHKMLRQQNLTEEEIKIFVRAITNKSLTPIQTTAFMLTQQFKKIDIEEVEFIARAFADSGNKLDWKSPIYDKHSIGGVPGNKVSLLIVPIIAASGLLIPKVSTKAITSASGTVDTMGLLCDVNFSPDELYEICDKTKGAIVSGERLRIAPAIDNIIKVAGYPLGIDPPSLILAGITSKKIAMGVDFMVLDLPVGKRTETKFNQEQGTVFGRTFVDLAHALGITAKVGITYGSVPVGHTIGPALEAREGLAALIDPQHAPSSLVEKATALTGLIFEMAGISIRGAGQAHALKILQSGKAYEKMKEMIEAQSGDPNIKPDDIELAPYILDFKAPADGWPVEIKNKALSQIARAAGAPEYPGAGVHLIAKKESVKKAEIVMRVFAHSEAALEEVRGLIAKTKPIVIEGLLLGTI